MDFLTFIKYIDTRLFFLINNLPHINFIDQFFLFFSFYPPIIWLVLGVLVIFIEERKDKKFIFRLLLALFLAGILSSGLIKPIIKRPRPDIRHGEKVVIVSEKPAVFFWNNDYAFPSGHASVAFAGAYILAHEVTKKKNSKRKIHPFFYYLIAILTCLSRIYLGKHYPLDVIGGGMLGYLMGFVAWKIVDLVKPKFAF
jgi:undecaprenyl-diphosphatase